MKPGRFPFLGVQDDEIRLGRKDVRLRGLATVKAPAISDPLRELVFGTQAKMDVSAEGPGWLLPRNEQGEFAVAVFGLCDPGLSRRFVMKNQIGMSCGVERLHMTVCGVGEANNGDRFAATGTDDFGVIIHRDQMVHFQAAQPMPMLGELAQDQQLIFANGNTGDQDGIVPEQVVIAGAESDRDAQLQQYLHPFVNVDQLRNDTLRVEHVQEISSQADQVVAIGDAESPVKPRFVEMKIGREKEFHLGIA